MVCKWTHQLVSAQCPGAKERLTCHCVTVLNCYLLYLHRALLLLLPAFLREKDFDKPKVSLNAELFNSTLSSRQRFMTFIQQRH